MKHEAYLKQIADVILQGPYKDDWASLAGRDMPAWMYEGKLGIFIHWGPYAVPAFGNEWYSRNMYVDGSPEFKHHVETYGPQKEFGYKDFIPLFTAEAFDPSSWAELFREAGAKYVIPVAEHHDGFQMYRSELSDWNAAVMGPKRDVLGELRTAFTEVGLVCGLSSHRVEHWFFMGHGRQFDSDVREPMERGDFYWPAMPEQDHHDLFSEPMPTADFLEDWLVRCCELVDSYRPKQFYFDWWIQHSAVKPYLKRFAAYYYNRAREWGEDVTICYKHDAFPMGTATVDIERGKFASPQTFRWQTDTAIARNSWCWTENNTFKSASSLIRDLVDIVSKNGVLLLNVGPKPDGTISDEDREVLVGMGRWLRENGEAVYGTIPWRIAMEGPTATPEGQFTDQTDTVFTAEDFRFTSRGKFIYATCLNWPASGEVTIRSLGEQDASHLPVFSGIVSEVEILNQKACTWTRDERGLHVTGDPKTQDMPVVIKITVD